MEVQRDESLRGKPAGVMQYNPFGDLRTIKPEEPRIFNDSNGSLIAVGYEARAAGVKRCPLPSAPNTRHWRSFNIETQLEGIILDVISCAVRASVKHVREVFAGNFPELLKGYTGSYKHKHEGFKCRKAWTAQSCTNQSW